MRIGFKGNVVDEPEIRAGFIGCGSHSFRNIYPVFHFAPVNLVAVCDLDLNKAQAFSKKFGADHAYTDYREMLAKEKLDAVFIVTGYDASGRPLYPAIAADCLNTGCHVWIEKPPAASCADIDIMRDASKKSGKHVVVGMKKMFFPANEKAKVLSAAPEFGCVSMAMLQYPQAIPTREEFVQYIEKKERVKSVVSFLDHQCHPVSLFIYLLGMPETLFYCRASSGAGSATFTYASGVVATLAFTHGTSRNGGMEHTTVIGDKGQHITVENNTRVTLHRDPPGLGYGDTPGFYNGSAHEASAVWEPEFSLGQLYNKGIFLLGYFSEVNEFARAILDKRAPAKGTLDQARQVTRIFEAFAEGSGKVIALA
ncbi:MAG: Gfo/Idh/MocA family oxidoreductase [Spirochaetes bacterium]|nr:Gfo/Idh/MocA family oxidoreductase [Spirochaetota bacterium]